MYCIKCRSHIAVKKSACPVCENPFIDDADHYFKLGMELICDDKIDSAIFALCNCIAIDPDHISGRANLASALVREKRYDDAMKQYVVIAQKISDENDLFAIMGKTALGGYIRHLNESEMFLRSTVKLLEKAVKQDPGNIGALINLCDAYLCSNDTEKAIECLEAHSDSEEVKMELAKIYYSLNRDDEAGDIVNGCEDEAESFLEFSDMLISRDQ